MKILIFIKSLLFNFLCIFFSIIYAWWMLSSDQQLINFLNPLYSLLVEFMPKVNESYIKLTWAFQLALTLWVLAFFVMLFILQYISKYIKILKNKNNLLEEEVKLINIYEKDKNYIIKLFIWFLSVLASLQLYLSFFYNK